MDIKKLIFILLGLFWPISLYLSNQTYDFIKYIIPTVLIAISFWLYNKKSKLFLYPLCAIPLVDVKLTILPLASVICFFVFKSKLPTGLKIIYLTIVIISMTINVRAFYQNSIFKLEYEAKQEILREIHLYPSVLSARIYQNKARIALDKMSDNFFGLIDPGNYFFSFHPREGLLINQNLVKFPFIALIPMLVGFLNITKMKNFKFITFILLAGISSLSFIEIFDRSDFILWLPLFAVSIHGINIIYKSKNKGLSEFFILLLVANSLIEFIRIFFIYRI